MVVLISAGCYEIVCQVQIADGWVVGVPSQSQVLGGSAAVGVCYNYQLSKVSLVTRIKWPIREECGNIFSIIKCEKLFTFGNIFGIFCVIAARPQPGVVMGSLTVQLCDDGVSIGAVEWIEKQFFDL